MNDREIIMDRDFTEGFAMAVRVGDRIELAGQGGWQGSDMTFPDDLGDEMAQAFANIGDILKKAGAGWDDVLTVHSYHVDLPGNQDFVNATMGALFAQHMPNHRPTWTDVGVTALGHPRMRVEVQIVAVRH